jgi:hypothetical protein
MIGTAADSSTEDMHDRRHERRHRSRSPGVRYLDFCATGPARLGEEAYWAYKDATAGLAEKDLDFAIAFAEDVGYPVKGTEAVRQLIRAGLKSR